MTIRKAARTVASLAFAGLGLAATIGSADAFYGSFAQSCDGIQIYGGGAYMTAYCRRLDGSFNFSGISNCGGAGVRNANGYLACGT